MQSAYLLRRDGHRCLSSEVCAASDHDSCRFVLESTSQTPVEGVLKNETRAI
jgi:hypothetical protein